MRALQQDLAAMLADGSEVHHVLDTSWTRPSFRPWLESEPVVKASLPSQLRQERLQGRVGVRFQGRSLGQP